MTEEDYWASDPDFHQIIETAAAQGEMLLGEAKIGQPNFGGYQIISVNTAASQENRKVLC